LSELDDPGTDELERRLDAAFASTRPRRGFEDELWRRLDAKRRWWQLLRLPAQRALPALGGLVGVLLVGFLVVTLVSSGTLRGHGAGGAASTTTSAGSPKEELTFGALPRPPAVPASEASSLGAGQPQPLVPRVPDSAALPAVPPRLPVYRYTASAGPPNGTVFEQAAVPPGLEAAYYPTRPPTDAAGDVPTAAQSTRSRPAEVTVSRARIVYVAVTEGGVGYLEPEYELSGTQKVGETTTAFVARVPALAAEAFR